MDGGARQQHGLDFEAWVKATFFETYTQPGPTDKWDATGVTFKGKYAAQTLAFGGLPVSIKTCRYGKSINFGDAVRQFENNQDFLLIVGFWQNAGSGKKVVSAKAILVSNSGWHALFDKDPAERKPGDDYTLMESKIRTFDSSIKSPFASKQDARRLAQSSKADIPPMYITLNPKIDDNQQRLQCSLSFKLFWSRIAKSTAAVEQNCTLFGEAIPNLK